MQSYSKSLNKWRNIKKVEEMYVVTISFQSFLLTLKQIHQSNKT